MDLISFLAQGLHSAVTARWGTTRGFNGKEKLHPEVAREIEAMIFNGSTMLFIPIAVKVLYKTVMSGSFQIKPLGIAVLICSLLGRVVSAKALILGVIQDKTPKRGSAGSEVMEILEGIVDVTGIGISNLKEASGEGWLKTLGFERILISRVTLFWLTPGMRFWFPLKT